MGRDTDPPDRSREWLQSDPLGSAEEAAALRADIARESGAAPAGPETTLQRLREKSAEWAMQALTQVTTALAGNLDLRALVSEILGAAIHALGAERGVLFLGRGDEGRLVPIMARNLNDEELTQVEGISRTILAVAQLRSVVSEDACADARFRDVPSVQEKQVRSLACTPLSIGAESVGVIYLDAPSRARAFPQHSLVFLEALAALAAAAIKNAQLHGEVRAQNELLRRRLTSIDALGGLAAGSERMRALLDRVSAAALVDEPVLISGETGTEIELLARALHELSPRAWGPFVAYRCGALPRDLTAGLLPRPTAGGSAGGGWGLPDQARGGVLFLADVTELDAALQARLAGLLAAAPRERRGAPAGPGSGVRIVGGTHWESADALNAGKLSAELYAALGRIEIRIPPLRERAADIPFLADRFLKRHAQASARPTITFTPAALELLQSLPWFGNVSELEHVVQRCLVFVDHGEIDVAQLERFALAPAGGRPSLLAAPPGAARRPAGAGGHFKSLAEREGEAIRSALIRANGNQSKAARLLGIHRNTLLRRMRCLEIQWEPPASRHPRRAGG